MTNQLGESYLSHVGTIFCGHLWTQLWQVLRYVNDSLHIVRFSFHFWQWLPDDCRFCGPKKTGEIENFAFFPDESTNNRCFLRNALFRLRKKNMEIISIHQEVEMQKIYIFLTHLSRLLLPFVPASSSSYRIDWFIFHFMPNIKCNQKCMKWPFNSVYWCQILNLNYFNNFKTIHYVEFDALPPENA